MQVLEVWGDKGRDVGLAHFNGVPILVNELALQYHREFRVEPSGRKRRKRWMVRKHEWTTPGCYQLANGTLVMHPTVYSEIRHPSSAMC